MQMLLIFLDTTLGYFPSTKLEIQENVSGLTSELSTEVQILLDVKSNSKFFHLLKPEPGNILSEYSLKTCFGNKFKKTCTWMQTFL